MLGGTRGKALEDGRCALQLYSDQGRAADTGPLCKSSVALPRQGAGRGDAASGHFVKDLCSASAGFLLIRGSQPRSSAPLPCPPPAPLPLRGVPLQLPGTAVGLHCPAWDTRQGLKKCDFFLADSDSGGKVPVPRSRGAPCGGGNAPAATTLHQPSLAAAGRQSWPWRGAGVGMAPWVRHLWATSTCAGASAARLCLCCRWATR